MLHYIIFSFPFSFPFSFSNSLEFGSSKRFVDTVDLFAKEMDLEHAALLCSSASRYQSPSTGALVPSVHPSTTFSRDAAYDAHRSDTHNANGDSPHEYVYSRADNPSALEVESVLAKLEGAEESCVFSSGMAVASAIMNALFVPKCVVFFPKRSYFVNRKHFREWCTRMRVRIVHYDTDEGSLEYLKLAMEMLCSEEEMHETFMWIETPANSSWQVLDIETVTGWCRATGVTSVVDATVLTPLLCRPLNLGADFVMHSCSKYLNGHSDVLAGVVSCKDRTSTHWKRIKEARVTGGAVLSPFDCFLLLRGMRTLHLRVPKASETGMYVAKSMEQFTFRGDEGENVSTGKQNTTAPASPTTKFQISPWFKLEVLYPGLPGHKNHAISKKQQAGKKKNMFGGMLSVVITPILPESFAKTAATEPEKPAQTNNNRESGINNEPRKNGTGEQTSTTTATIPTAIKEGEAELLPSQDTYANKWHSLAFEMAKTTATMTKIWRPATSLGGPESLIEHRASIEGSDSVVPWSQCPAGLLRLSCGLEPGHRLVRDLRDALHAAHLKVCCAHGLLKTPAKGVINSVIKDTPGQRMLSQQPLVNRDTINVVDEDTSVQRLLPQQPMVSRDIIYGGGNGFEGVPLAKQVTANEKKRPHPDTTAEETPATPLEPVGDLTLDIPLGSLEEPKMTKIRKPRKSVEKPAPLPDEQRCCKKSTQWHCSKARFGATRFCEKHQDCVLKEMEGPKKRGRKPGSLRPTAVNADGMNDRVRDMQQLAVGAKQMSAIVSQAQAVAALTQLDELQRVTTTAITAVPMKTSSQSGQPQQTTAPPAVTTPTMPTTTNAALDPLSQNVASNVPQPSSPINGGNFNDGDLDMPISMVVTDSGRINLLARDVQTRMDNN